MNVIYYAKKIKKPLLLEITGDGPKRTFKESAEQYQAHIRRYCAWFKTEPVSVEHDDFKEVVVFGNGITFSATLAI